MAHLPTPLPDRVVLTWNDNPATTQSVNWRTDISVKKGFAQLAIANANGRTLKPKEFNIVVLPFGAKLFLKGSIASLGSGIDKSVFSDSMESCFESNYGVEFVDNYDDADLEMYFEVSSNDNLRRENRKQAFKSEAYLNLKLVEINSKIIILDHVIASKKASNFDFIERAGINALKDLSQESLNVFCD